MYDFHVHSNFSDDCNYSMEEMVEGAIKNGIKIMTFTDHMDHDYGNCEYDFVFNVDDYFKEFNRVKELFKDSIKLVSGVEIGMQTHLVNKIHDLIPIDKFDFIIMSIHTAKGQELHEGNFYKGKTASKAYFDYYEDIYNCVKNFDDFDILGHINMLDRYTKFLENPKIDFKEYKHLVADILKKIIYKDKGIEINTSGIRYGLDSFHPNLEFLKLYKDLGGKIITFGSDAHVPTDTGFMYNDVMKTLNDLGFKYIATFESREIKFIQI